MHLLNAVCCTLLLRHGPVVVSLVDVVGGRRVSCVAYIGVLSYLPGRSPAGTVHAQLAVGVTLVSAALRAKIGVLHPRLLWLVKAYHTRPHPCRKSTMREDGMMSGPEP